MTTRRRAAIYCRISQDREGAGLGVDRQEQDCRQLAKQLGWTVVGIYVDNDVSAYSGKPRPQYRRLLDDLDASAVNAVLVWHTDRLHRSPRELEAFIDLAERRGVVTQTVTAGSLDLATPSGRMVARMLGAASRQEVEHKAERTVRAQAQAARAGRWRGGPRPLGWTIRPDGSAVLDQPAARRIRQAAADVLAGVSLSSIAGRWNAAGFTTSTGRAWTYGAVKQVLLRSVNAGLVTYRGDVIGPSAWPPIVTEDVWLAVKATLTEPGRLVAPSTRARHLLAGLALCGGCGRVLRSGANGQGAKHRPVYRCDGPGTRHVSRNSEPIDEWVTAVIEARLARPDCADLLTKPGQDVDVAALRTEQAALRKRETTAAEQYADGEITGRQLAVITARITADVERITKALTSAYRTSGAAPVLTAADPVRAWRAASLDQKRRVIRELLTVTVLPGRHCDPARIDWITP